MESNSEFANLLLKYPFLSQELIEKDIYLSEIIKDLVIIFDQKEWKNNYFLCGGTSLSKCFKVTNRLSEDIDISIFGLTKSKRKRIIKEISTIIDEIENKNIIKVNYRDKLWSQRRWFLHCKFNYKKIEFSFDVKSIQVPLEDKHVSKKHVYDIVQKLSKNQVLEILPSIPVVDIEFIVAEKLLVFHKRFINDSSKIIDESKIIENYDVNRLFRHVYDVFMIFDKKLISKTKENFLLINKWFIEISNFEVGFDTPLNKINLFQKGFLDHNKTILKTILKKECYEKINIKELILFYQNIGEEFNDLK